MFGRCLRGLLALALCLGVGGALAANVAVLVFPNTPKMAPYARVAQTRIEQLLADNGLTVLDQDKAKELQKGWKNLADPSYLVTAEDLVARAAKYKIAGLYRLYLTGSVEPALGGYYSATAHVDLRYVDAEARVAAVESPAMGVRGAPPSDGLTDSAAQVNAVQRAVDQAAEKAGLKVFDSTSPRAMALRLTEHVGLPGGNEVGSNERQAVDAAHDGLAPLVDQAWAAEQPTCRAKSPDGKMLLLGTLITQTSRRAMSRAYGARLHVIDLEAGQTILSFTLHEVGRRGEGENGPSQVLDCLFVGSWRFAAAATGNRLAFYDLERGLVLSEFAYRDGPEKLRLSHVKRGSEDFLRLAGERMDKAFAIAPQR